ncbi:MAG: sigma-70 family RNA polymerase sigma factor [Spirochaetaceae bacterium]|nr:sigma-70 family RNA polymerase sigma factor [Myxococcales bacterium]MCB9726564.1 sigma-70 family RNA polymerase sigma factor [Spirochaetaceae bacterium]HPG26040.1 sigma-70 family RNA polymerase sigma factor [Myxococcota bacterium]
MAADETRRSPDAYAETSDARFAEWMAAAQRGDGDAYRALLEALRPRIRALVGARVRDPAAAEDVVQNALLSIHRGRASYRPERPFMPWMRAIVRNAIVDHFRDRARRGDREIPLDVELWADDDSGREVDDAVLPPELAAALAALPPAQREAVTLIQVEGLSVAEAALRAGVSAGALKVRAHRGYRAMRASLDGARIGGEWRSGALPGAGPGQGGRGTR